MTKENSFDALNQARESMRKAAHTTEHIDARNAAREKIEQDSPDSLVDKVKHMFIAARRMNKVYDAAAELYAKVSPYIGKLVKPAVWVAGKLKDGFMFAAYDHENGKLKLDKDGDPVFSPARLGKAFVIAAGLGLAANVGVQAAYFHGTQFTEVVYVTGKSPIEKGELYQFTGCTSLPCSTNSDNGKYFQIEKSLIFPTLIYPEEDVFANIPQQGAACEVEGYGIYFKQLKPIFKWAEWYQNVHNVSCRPYTAQEMEAAIGSGKINQNPSPGWEGP